jgi:hypothetical protein
MDWNVIFSRVHLLLLVYLLMIWHSCIIMHLWGMNLVVLKIFLQVLQVLIALVYYIRYFCQKS